MSTRKLSILLVVVGLISTISFMPTAAALTPGSQLWVSSYDSGGFDSAKGIVTSPDGADVFVTGNSATVAYDSTDGSQLWVAPYDPPAEGTVAAIVMSPDGATVFVTDTTRASNGVLEFRTLAYDASDGAQLWATFYDGVVKSSSRAIAVSPHGARVFVTGVTRFTGRTTDYATVAYDASTGTHLWARRYNGPGDGDDKALAIRTSPDGSMVFVTGDSAGQIQPYDFATVAYRTRTGDRVWVRRYNGDPGDTGARVGAIAVAPDGSMVFVVGVTYQQGVLGTSIAYDAVTGTRVWLQHRKVIEGSVAVSPDGSQVIVGGTAIDTARTCSSGGECLDYLTIAYDASTGTKWWASRFFDDGNDSESSLAVSPDGSEVFVTGRSYPAGDVTVAYGATTGNEVWVSRFPTDASYNFSTASSVAANPDGSSVFITGRSLIGGSYYNYATVAYAA